MNAAKPSGKRPRVRKGNSALVEEFRFRNSYYHELEAELYHLQIEHDTLIGAEVSRSEPLGDRTEEQVYHDLKKQASGQIVKNLKWVGAHIDSLQAEIEALKKGLQGLREPERALLDASTKKGGNRGESGHGASKGSTRDRYSKREHAKGVKGRKPKMGNMESEEDAATPVDEVKEEEDLMSFD